MRGFVSFMFTPWTKGHAFTKEKGRFHFSCATQAAAVGSSSHRLQFFQIHRFSSSLTSSETSFTINYLINSCGFTPERALSASKNMKFKGPDKPDSVLRFFKAQGFTEAQISKLIKVQPRVLLCKPEETLLPKLQFLNSKGISSSDMNVIITRSPHILLRSLENQLIPSFNFFSNLIQSDEKTIAAIKRSTNVLLLDLQKILKPNIETLKQAGVSSRNIGFLLRHQPRSLMITCEKFRQTVEKVAKMGFNPLKFNFSIAVHALISMRRSTWDRKIEVYKKWGWSEHDLVAAFRKHPSCMTVSEDKITLAMEFLVHKMGWKSLYLANRPTLILLSLNRRIVPRCEVYQALVLKGIIKPGDISLTKLLMPTETQFLQDFTNCYKGEAPELFKLYKEKLDLAK